MDHLIIIRGEINEEFIKAANKKVNISHISDFSKQ